MDRIGLLVSSANTLFHHDYTSFFLKIKMCIRGVFFCLIVLCCVLSDLKVDNLLPSIIPFASMNKTVVLMGQGMFRDEFRSNLVVFVSFHTRHSLTKSQLPRICMTFHFLHFLSNPMNCKINLFSYSFSIHKPNK